MRIYHALRFLKGAQEQGKQAVDRIGFKWLLLAALMFGFASADPAMAQRRGFLAGLFGNGQNNRSQPAVSSGQRRVNRAVQNALNFFGFDAGPVDGIFGRKSRAAASEFQAFLDYEATGRLTREESQFLLTSFNEIANKDEALALKVSLGLVSAQDLLKALAEGETVVAELPEEPAQIGPLSMRDMCVNIGASGPIDLLKAQFCNLRQLAIEQSDFLIETSLNGQSVEPVMGECRLFTAEMRPQFQQLATMDSTEMLAEMDLWVLRAGVAGEKLTRLSETCLGVAYKNDNSEAALASLLVLGGLKNAIYIELTGYHLALELGPEFTESPHARSWMEAAVAAQTDENIALTAQTSAQRTDVLVDVIRILATVE
jgi:hypothetical protein